MPILHLIANAIPGLAPLASNEAAWWMMRALREAWPDALAACVMPTHVHIVVKADSVDGPRLRLGQVIAGFSRHTGQQRTWMPVREPKVVADRKHLIRLVRYLHLNPCRWAIVADPARWPYSTHRDVLGARVDPWVAPERLARESHFHGPRFSEWFHRYVAADSNTSPAARQPLRRAACQDIPQVPLALIVQATTAATPWSPLAVWRRTFVGLARAQGWTNTTTLARAAGVGVRRVQTLSVAHEPQLLQSAALCLGDDRLRFVPTDFGRLQ